MVDLDHLAIPALAFRSGDRSVGGGVNGLSIGGLEIHAGMVRHALEDGVTAFAETTGDGLIGRRAGNRQLPDHLLGRFKRVERCAQIIKRYIEGDRVFGADERTAQTRTRTRCNTCLLQYGTNGLCGLVGVRRQLLNFGELF